MYKVYMDSDKEAKDSCYGPSGSTIPDDVLLMTRSVVLVMEKGGGGGVTSESSTKCRNIQQIINLYNNCFTLD